MDPIISIIIPVYQVEQYIVECVDSVINQTYKNLDIILVDDGSKDRSGIICDEYAKKDSRITVIHKENGGLVSARKAGIKIAKGDYIAYVDSDDYIDLDMYEMMYRRMEESDADIIISGHTEVFDHEEKKVVNHVAPGLYEGEDRKKVFSKMLYEPIIGLWGLSPACWDKLFKKEKMYDLQMNVDERIWDGEDHAFTYAVILDSKSILVDDIMPYHHRIRPNSVATGYDAFAFERLSILMHHCRKQFESSEYWNECLKKQFPYWMRWFLYKHIYTELGIPPISLPWENEGYVFPFEKVEKGERIILYGAGDVGRDYYRQIITTEYCNVVAWTSANWESNDFKELLDSPDNALKKAYDKIIVAVNIKNVAEEIKEHLKKEYSIPENVIVWRHPYKKRFDRLING